MTSPAVRMRRIDKRFGTVHANRGVDLTVAVGTVHGIVGENGAGKSTLMSILYGFHPADSGEIEVQGQRVRIDDSRQAIALGIGMVHQHFMLVEDFSALDNVMLGAEPDWHLGRARDQARTRLETLMGDTGLHVQLDAPVSRLPVGERQRLEILKTLYRGARILILDEPTAVLTPQETQALFGTLRQLRAQGTTVLLITHKLKEVLALCDAVTVMRAGQVVLDRLIGEVTLDSLAQAMVGRQVKLGRATTPPAGVSTAMPTETLVATTGGTGIRQAQTISTPLLQVQGLCLDDAQGVPRLQDVSLTLRAGEIVGVAGVSGNGQGELLDVLAGLAAPHVGLLTLGKHRFTPAKWLDPTTARTLCLAHVPEDRHRRGLVLPFAAWESAVLGYQGLRRYGPRGWLRRRVMQDDCAQAMGCYDVRPRAPLLRTSKFSGGNQQKLVLAREAAHVPQVLLVGQPTRGVDIGAIEFIHARLRALRDAGGAVLLVSSELDEILALSDRVLVMNGGRITGELPIEQCSEAVLGRLMGGVADSQENAAPLPNFLTAPRGTGPGQRSDLAGS